MIEARDRVWEAIEQYLPGLETAVQALIAS
jgi:hypothetical protein